MYSLLSGFYHYLFQKPTYKVLIIGLDGAGKTTLLEQVKKQEGQKSMNLEKIPPTVGLNITKVEKRNAEFVFWDVGGQMVLRKIWDKYFAECNAIVFVIDGSDQIRFDEVKETVGRLYDPDNPTDLIEKPLLFLLNKSDSP